MKTSITKQKRLTFFLLSLIFVLFFLSFSGNVFQIADKGILAGFDIEDEGLIVGRIEKSSRDGILSVGGFPCAYNNPDTFSSTNAGRTKQLANFLSDIPNQGELYIYTSQSGGQGMMYSLFYKVLPFKNLTVFYIFRAFNAALLALCFTLLLAWCFRNFSRIGTLVAAVFIFLSPGLVYFGHNLWWALWSFYIPFLTMLLLLEYKQKNPDKLHYKKIYLYLFLAIFFKCLFTGFEFITSSLVAGLSPFVFYAILNRENWKKSLQVLFIAGVVEIIGVLAQMLVMIGQFKLLSNSFMVGIQYIINSFSKSSAIAIHMDVKPELTEILWTYFTSSGLLQTYFLKVNVTTYGLTLLISIFALFTYYLVKRSVPTFTQKYKALIGVWLFSILAPLSWYIVFQVHAMMHPFFDYIVLYMPFLLFGFLIIGEEVNLIIKQVKGKTLL